MRLRHLRLAAALAALSLPLAAYAQRAAPDLRVGAGIAVAATESGNVQGFVRHGITTFRGIPYAQAERFEAPKPAAKWDEIKQTLSWGNICPQPVDTQIREPQTFISDNRFWPQAEACQNLNIWTPALDGKKRPVMVWLHGGGYFSGSSNELPIYDGTALSKKGDVVIVSINHRLNILGFLDLSAYGERYRSSGNAGMEDIVAALRWVHDNIAAFGGDPSNVTIFGQSGGGDKVSTLLAAPSAHGLFGKAIIQSGIMGPPMPSPDPQKASRLVAKLVFQFAGLAEGDVQGLKALPYDKLTTAGMQALLAASDQLMPGQKAPLSFPRINWEPVVDGAFLPEKPFASGAPAISADVPLLIGSTLNEFSRFPTPDTMGREGWNEAQALQWAKAKFGPRADAVIAGYRAAYPGTAPREWPTIDVFGRLGALQAARSKAGQVASVYNYVFAWQTPVLDGFWGAGHSMDLPFVFGDAKLGEQATGGGPAVAKLTDQMSRTWIAFARTGSPNGPGLPVWPRFTVQGGATMIFDNASAARQNHDHELLDLLAAPPKRD